MAVFGESTFEERPRLNEVRVGPDPCDWCPHGTSRSGHRRAHRDRHVRTRGADAIYKPGRGAPEGTREHLDPGPPASGAVRARVCWPPGPHRQADATCRTSTAQPQARPLPGVRPTRRSAELRRGVACLRALSTDLSPRLLGRTRCFISNSLQTYFSEATRRELLANGIKKTHEGQTPISYY